MAEHLKDSALPRALSQVIEDVVDLFQREVRLARTEVLEKVTAKLRAGAWLSVTACAAVISVFLVVEALVFGLAAYGLALHWACLVVAALMGFFSAVVPSYHASQVNIVEGLRHIG